MTEVEKLGQEALERARNLLAKAQGTKAKDLEEDFEDLDHPDLPEDLEEASEVDEEERDDQDDEDVAMHRYQGEEDEEEEDEEDEGDRPVAKAVDALPLLAAIEKRLRLLEAQEKRLRALVKAVGALVEGLEVVAKGYSTLANTPRRPKSHSAVVPTAGRDLPPAEILAKALSVVRDPVRVGILEHYVNRGDVEGALAQLTPEERALVLGGK